MTILRDGKRVIDEEAVMKAVCGGANRLSAIMAVVGCKDERAMDRVLQKLRRQHHLGFDSKKGWTKDKLLSGIY
jgi:predicted 3-demethylubiquinone-9 3-methyltransferase (glyoxalase superfamily)